MTAPAITPVRPRPARSGRQAIYDYLAVLTGGRGEGLLELRYRLDGQRFARRFYPAARAAGLVEAVTRLGSRSDVYVGCARRARRAGGRAAIDHVHVAWVDCDTAASVDALAGLRPAPTMTVRSGPVGRHAYWALAAPVSPEEVEAVNRGSPGRLAPT